MSFSLYLNTGEVTLRYAPSILCIAKRHGNHGKSRKSLFINNNFHGKLKIIHGKFMVLPCIAS